MRVDGTLSHVVEYTWEDTSPSSLVQLFSCLHAAKQSSDVASHAVGSQGEKTVNRQSGC